MGQFSKLNAVINSGLTYSFESELNNFKIDKSCSNNTKELFYQSLNIIVKKM